MKVTSIPTTAPGWYDPALPNFPKRTDWTGSRMRVTVPVEKDPPREMAAARKTLEKKYPGALLRLVPEILSSVSPIAVDVRGGDEALLRSYLSQVTIQGGTVDQAVYYIQKFLPLGGLFGVQGLRFKRAICNNVLSFENVNLDLDLSGLTLLRGVNMDWYEKSNGAGKSSLVTLPFLPLFGRTFKGQTHVHNGWARQRTILQAKSVVMIDLPDGKEMVVHRFLRPSSLAVHVDGKNVSMADANQTQALIEKLTNLTWEVLTNSVYIGQREIGSVFGTDKERKELFSRLLGLDRFLEAQEKLRKIVLRRERAVEAAEGEIDNIQAMIREAATGTAEIESALKDLPTVAKDVNRMDCRIGDVRAGIKKLQTENADIDEEVDANQKTFDVLYDKCSAAEARSDFFFGQIDSCSKVGAECPMCGTAVSVKHLEDHVRKLQWKKKISDVLIMEYEEKKTANRTIRRALIEKINEKREKITELMREQSRLELQRQEAQHQVEERGRLENLLRSKTERADRLRAVEQAWISDRAACVEEKLFAQACADAVGRDGLPKYLCSVAAPQLNAAAARYSQTFADGEIGLTFDGDLNVSVMNAHGGSAIKDQSAGEMRMAAIIAALSFRDVLVNHNILVLDEPTEGLDPENSAAFARGMNAVVERFKHVIVISHNRDLLAELEPDRTITVIKEGGISRVEYS